MNYFFFFNFFLCSFFNVIIFLEFYIFFRIVIGQKINSTVQNLYTVSYNGNNTKNTVECITCEQAKLIKDKEEEEESLSCDYKPSTNIQHIIQVFQNYTGI